jgi:hypothetical protein
MLPGQLITGASCELTVTKNEHDLELRALSNAVHVTSVVPDSNELPLGGVQDVFLIPEPSVADEEMLYIVCRVVVLPVSFKFWFDGHVNDGGVLSVTNTLKTGQLLEFPALSVAEQATGLVPRPKVLPDANVHPEFASPELSTAANTHEAVTVGVLPLVGVRERGDVVVYGGQVSVGGVASVLVIGNAHVVTLLSLSVAVQPTYVVPSAVVSGLETLQDCDKIPELSEDETEKGTTTDALTPLVGDTDMMLGHVNTGGALSIIARGNEQTFVLPALSVAVHATVVVVET